MKEWIKNYWFSLLCFGIALFICLFICIGMIFWSNDDDYIHFLLTISSMSTPLLLCIVAVANLPRKGK